MTDEPPDAGGPPVELPERANRPTGQPALLDGGRIADLHSAAAASGSRTRAETARRRSRELHSKIHLDLADALALLDQVTTELNDAREKIANLEIALQSSRRIGQALGIMMDRLAVTEDEAFTRLRMASQRSHRKLRDIAEEIVYTGQIPPAAA
jgi:hypothetical protein